MKINGISNSGMTSGQAGNLQKTDAVSKSIQKQIANVQKQLQELSADKNLTMEEKMKKRQELQQRLTELNQELQQHQIDLRRERQQAQKAENSQNERQQTKTEKEGAGLSRSGMEALISADSSMKQAQVYKGVATELKGEIRTLRSDIASDEKRGLDVSKKKAQLAKMEKRVEKAISSQIDTLEEAGKILQENRKEEQEEMVHGREEEQEETVHSQKKGQEEMVHGREEEQEEKKENGNAKLPGKSVDVYL